MRQRPMIWTLHIMAWALIWPMSGAAACDWPEGWSPMLPETESAAMEAALFLADGRAPVSKPFDIIIRTCGEQPATIDRIAVEAIMPKHRHGMNYTPDIERMADGSYVVRRLVFHMPGDWRIMLSTYSGATITRHLLDVVAKGR